MNNRPKSTIQTELLEDIELTALPDRRIKKNLDNKHPNTNLVLTLSKVDEKIPLVFLRSFKEPALLALEQKYTRSRYELEKIISNNPKKFKFDYIQNLLAIGTNIPWVFFSLKTSGAGIQGFAKIIDPTAEVPNAPATGVGATLSTIGAMTYIFFADASKEAALSTLEYALADDYGKQIDDKIAEVKKNPIIAARFIRDASILGTTYLTSGMTMVIPFMNDFNVMPAGLKWLVIGTLQYFGWRYNDSYMTKSYYEGLDFWENKEDRPWLYQKVLKGDVTAPLQVFFQGIISSVGLRSFPSYYYMAQASAESLGFWIHPTSVAILVGLHSLCVLYPATFNQYMQADEKTDALLKKNIPWDQVNHQIQSQIKQLNLATLSTAELSKLKQTIVTIVLQSQLAMLGDKAHEKLDPTLIHLKIHSYIDQLKLTMLDDTELNKFKELMTESMIEAEKELIKSKIRDEKGFFLLYKEEPWSALTVAWQGFIGGYFGAKFIAPALANSPPGWFAAILGTLGASTFAAFAHHAETNRVLNNLTLKQLEEMQKSDQKAAENKQTATEKAAAGTAAAIVTINAVSSTLGTIGSSALLGNPSALQNTVIAATATQNGLNSISYNYSSVAETLNTIFDDIGDSFHNIYHCFRTASKASNAPATLFFKKEEVKKEELARHFPSITP